MDFNLQVIIFLPISQTFSYVYRFGCSDPKMLNFQPFLSFLVALSLYCGPLRRASNLVEGGFFSLDNCGSQEESTLFLHQVVRELWQFYLTKRSIFHSFGQRLVALSARRALWVGVGKLNRVGF